MIHRMWRGYKTVSLLINLAAVNLFAAGQGPVSAVTSDLILDTTVCQLRSSPEEFDRKQIRVNAYFHFGFEERGMYDRSCAEDSSENVQRSKPDQFGFWVEFAGAGVKHEGVKGYRPLVKDDKLQQFDDVEKLRDDQMLRAVLIGTFYAARPAEKKPGQRLSWPRAYGHMGCCHLFVVSQVESVETHYSQDLDYSPGGGVHEPQWCYSHETFDRPNDEEIRSWQQTANNGNDRWRLDPIKVAAEQLEAMRFGRFKDSGHLSWETVIPEDPQQARSFLAPPDDRPTETLLEAESQPSRKTYEYISRDRKSRMIIMVVRPYWLEQLAVSPANVIWAPVDAARVACFAPGEVPKPHSD